jgi:hypothetical protein
MLKPPPAAVSPLDEYLAVADIRDAGKSPLFRSTAGRTGTLADRPMHRIDA